MLFFRGGKNLRYDALVNAVVEFVVPDLAGGSRLILDALLAGLVVSQGLGTSGDTALADLLHLIDGFVVFISLSLYNGLPQLRCSFVYLFVFCCGCNDSEIGEGQMRRIVRA